MWTILLWALGLCGAAIIVALFFFVRDMLRLQRKKRRRWALAVGLPARIATLARSERDREMSAPDPELFISICNFSSDMDWLMAEAIKNGDAVEEDEAETIRRTKARIQLRLTGMTARKLASRPLDGYQIRDALAWDASMLVEEARLAETLGWLETPDVWGLLFLNARRVQDTFESWQDFVAAAMRGREYELRFNTGKHASPRVTEMVIKKLEERSSFTEVAWREFRVFRESDLNTANS